MYNAEFLPHRKIKRKRTKKAVKRILENILFLSSIIRNVKVKDLMTKPYFLYFNNCNPLNYITLNPSL